MTTAITKRRSAFTSFTGVRVSEVHSSTIVVICAEPCMGARDALTYFLNRNSGHDIQVIRRDFAGLGAEAATRNIVRLARDIKPITDQVVVGIDGVPPADEAQIERIVRAFRKMTSQGAAVVVWMLPEARQLLEELPEAVVLTARDLLIERDGSPAIIGTFGGQDPLTRGIPSLVRPLVGLKEVRSNEQLPGPYLESLAELVSSSLRSSLSSEEIRLRLCMILLGDGSAEDLRWVLPRVDDGMLAQLHDDAPLFGVSSRLDGFCCLHGRNTTLLDASVVKLMDVVPAISVDAMSCARLLIDRGQVARAAVVLRLAGSAATPALVITRAAEFIDAGEGQLVAEALARVTPESVSEFGITMERVRKVQACVLVLKAEKLLASADTCKDDEDPSAGKDAASIDHELTALNQLPALAAGRVKSYEPEENLAVGALVDKLNLHSGAMRFLLDGKCTAALRLVVSQVCGASDSTISNALLRLDYEAARILLMDRPLTSGLSLKQAKRLLSSPVTVRLQGYVSCIEVLGMLMRGVNIDQEIGSLAARFEREQDLLAQTVISLAGAISDLKSRSLARAVVRTNTALQLAKAMKLTWVMRLSQLINDIARFLAGEHYHIDEHEEYDDDLGRVCLVVRDLMASERAGSISAPHTELAVPWDALWLLHLMREGVGELSELLAKELPATWADALLRAEEAMAEDGAEAGPGQQLPVMQLRRQAQHFEMAAPVHLRVLGNLSLAIQGEEIPSSRLNTRGIRDLLVYLATRPGNVARRYDMTERVLHRRGYPAGINRVYRATSAFRVLVSEYDPSLQPLLSHRASRSISFNP